MLLSLNKGNSSFKVCVDTLENGLINGKVFGCRLCKPMPFNDINSLILGIETVMEVQGIPQSFQQSRTFNLTEPVSPYAASSKEQFMPQETVAAARGELVTFEITVETRASSSWQGTIIAGDGAVTEFDSVLELMRIIDAASEKYRA